MKSNEVGITFKQTINDNVKNLSKMIKNEKWEECYFYIKNLILATLMSLVQNWLDLYQIGP